jgi:phosphatidylinositol alpha-mannosyltransferase
VTRHIEALAERYIAEGHHVRVLAPYDPPDRFSAALHRGAHPQPVEAPDYLVPMGRTIGFNANGAVSNLSITPYGLSTAQMELRTGRYDVLHVHEPLAPVPPWVITDWMRLPLVATFHTYNENLMSNGIANLLGARRMLNRLHVRLAVSEAAAWTARRFFGGHYRIVPNGVHVDSERAARAASRPAGETLRLVFVGQAVELSPYLLDTHGVRVLGKVDDETKTREVEQADFLCAPSLRGESFGMVLTEAFAAGTPVVASNIPGYRDVVRDGIDGVLVPPGDAQVLAEVLRDLYDEPARRAEMARAAVRDVERFAWPRVAGEVMEAYAEAIATPAPEGARARLAVRVGARAADLKPHVRARRLKTLEPKTPAARRSRATALMRRGALIGVSLGGAALGYYGLSQIGFGHIASALLNSSPTYVLLGLVVMCSAMVARAFSWDAILKAALPRARIRLVDAMQGTMIGVLMSSTLPARLGEPARAMVVARRTGRPRENFPVVRGTLVSQTLLNLVALAILGAIMFSSVNFFNGHQDALLIVAIVPVALLALVLLVPALLRHSATRRFARLHALMTQIRGALTRVRAGLAVFRRPKLGAVAAVMQLTAWGLQALACYLLLIALGLSHQTGFAAAAAVLFAVNVTAVVPATPANLGVFQAACVAVLHTGWHVGFAAAFAYGVILQGVEVATAILMGMPALLKEGMSWREIKMRAMHATPVKLPPRPSSRERSGGGAVSAEG